VAGEITTCPTCGGGVTVDAAHHDLVPLMTGAQADAAHRMARAWLRRQDSDADLAQAVTDFLEIETYKDWVTRVRHDDDDDVATR
jgi:hypothetical protein